ncbi:MAG: EF-hand domain-containing protein [Candidatus Neomarinimicrobiota bacterium]|nr:EF-hand domain-containing protein [Candidatus Neomarinimicrobiota bacterium]
MRNYTLLFSFLFLFVVSDLDAQRRSGRASKRIDESKNVENVKPDDDLYKKFGFSSRDQLVEFLLEKDLSRSEKRTVEKYGKGKKLSKSQTRQFRGLLKKYAEEREVSQAGRSGRVSSDRALSGSGRGSSASRAPSRGRSGRVSGDRALSGSGRGSSASRAPSRGRSGRQAADMDYDCDPNQDYPQMDPGPDGGCADYADCNGNGVFDVGEPCYEGDDQGPSFDEVDANNDGEISYSEAQAVFGQEPDFDERFNEVDSDNNGSVDMAEWEAAGDNDQNDGQ